MWGILVRRKASNCESLSIKLVDSNKKIKKNRKEAMK